MAPGDHGLAPAPGLAERFRAQLEHAPELREKIDQIDWSIAERHPLIDSAQISPEDWEALSIDCAKAANTQGIIIVHGTDTLAYTASALAYLLAGINIPVIITGAQKPLEAENSDALNNLSGAMLAIHSAKPGVWVYFNQKLMPGVRSVKKDALRNEGFDAPRLFDSLIISQTKLGWQHNIREWADFHVSIVHMVPGYKPEQLNAVIASRPQAIVLSLFALGSLPDSNTALITALKAALDNNIIVVAVSQCYVGRVDFSVYATGSVLYQLGILSGQDMTLEAAYTKLMVLLRLGYSTEKIALLFQQNTVGELTQLHDE